MMKLRRRNRHRASVASLLVLALLGLGALDATICRGVDGHFNIDTHVNSCCGLTIPVSPSTEGPDRDPSTGWDVSGGSPTCSDTPLIHGTLTAHRDDLAAGGFGCSITIYRPTLVASTVREIAPSFCSESFLCRLRSTALRI
jgi:hypothetical protein